jgi:hypothetical protein
MEEPVPAEDLPAYTSPFDVAAKEAEGTAPLLNLSANPSAVLKILEISPDLINFATRLRGVEITLNKKTGQWEQRQAKEPLINDAGINFIFGVLENVATVSAKTSILSIERIYAIEKTNIEVINNGLFISQKQFGISDESYEVIAPAITAECLSTMDIILRHSECGKTQSNLFRIFKESNMNVTSSEPKKGGLLHDINPLNWGK